MSVALLDVNVLVALFDPAHAHHDGAHRWFAQNRKRGWATCPITAMGCVRVLSNPTYPSVEATPGEVVSHLRSLCSTADHHFWPDSVSLTDGMLFRSSVMTGHQTITDVYLLGLAVRNHGRLATFDRKVSLPSVAGATAANLVILPEG